MNPFPSCHLVCLFALTAQYGNELNIHVFGREPGESCCRYTFTGASPSSKIVGIVFIYATCLQSASGGAFGEIKTIFHSFECAIHLGVAFHASSPHKQIMQRNCRFGALHMPYLARNGVEKNTPASVLAPDDTWHYG